VVFTRGSLADGVALRVVAREDGTSIATWDTDVIESKLVDCPWVIDELRVVADRLQALAGVCMGKMGERLDDSLRGMVTDRCEVRQLLPDETFIKQGDRVGGMHIVGAGRLFVTHEDGASEELGPGDFLFAAEVLGGGAAPATVRAGHGGALVLLADRMAAHELLVSVPPLLEILAS
jgi:CRP-like cAMP-binding protein